LDGDWQWQDGLVLAAGARLRMTRALRGDVLIAPLVLAAKTPITLGSQGIDGRLQLQAGGVTAARWQLPPLQAGIALDGWQFTADVRVPAWNGTLALHGRDLNTAPNGTFDARLPLQPAISRGLGVIAHSGVLSAGGDWHFDGALAVDGRLQASNTRLDWGSISA